jgi:hypothetical protein
MAQKHYDFLTVTLKISTVYMLLSNTDEEHACNLGEQFKQQMTNEITGSHRWVEHTVKSCSFRDSTAYPLTQCDAVRIYWWFTSDPPQ